LAGPNPYKIHSFAELRRVLGPLWVRCDTCRRFRSLRVTRAIREASRAFWSRPATVCASLRTVASKSSSSKREYILEWKGGSRPATPWSSMSSVLPFVRFDVSVPVAPYHCALPQLSGPSRRSGV
jgi:hypothetical protein